MPAPQVEQPRQDAPISDPGSTLFSRSQYLFQEALTRILNLISVLLSSGNDGQPFISGAGSLGAFGQLNTITAQCTVNTTLTNVLADITGATIQLTTGLWLIRANVYTFYNVTSQGVRVGLNLAGTDLDVQALGYPNPAMVSTLVTATGTDIWTGMMSQEWRVSISGTITAKLRGYKLFNGGAAFAGNTDTTLTAEQIG